MLTMRPSIHQHFSGVVLRDPGQSYTREIIRALASSELDETSFLSLHVRLTGRPSVSRQTLTSAAAAAPAKTARSGRISRSCQTGKGSLMICSRRGGGAREPFPLRPCGRERHATTEERFRERRCSASRIIRGALFIADRFAL